MLRQLVLSIYINHTFSKQALLESNSPFEALKSDAEICSSISTILPVVDIWEITEATKFLLCVHHFLKVQVQDEVDGNIYVCCVEFHSYFVC